MTLDLTVLIGPPDAGKSTWTAQSGWPGDAVFSLDAIRAELCGAAARQDRNRDVVALRDRRLREALRTGRAGLVDATNTVAAHRAALLAVAAEYGAITTAVVFTAPLVVCLRRNAARDRHVPEHVIARMHAATARLSRRSLKREGFDHVTLIR